MHILILGARSPVALEWARAFKSSGYTVSVADCIKFPLTRFSNCIDHFFYYASPRHHLNIWCEQLINYIKKNSISLVIPTTEEAFYLSYKHAVLSKFTTLFVADFSLMRQLHHKGDFAKLVQNFTIKTPKTIAVSDKETLLNIYTHKIKEKVIKPAYSRFASATLIKPSLDQLIAIDSISPQFPWIIQDFIAGRELCSFTVFKEGKVMAHSSYQPIYRAGKGAGIYFKPDLSEKIIQFVHEFGTNTQFTGQAGFDFIEDADENLWVLECNPRGTSGIHLFNKQHKELSQQIILNTSESLYSTATQPLTFKFAMLFVAFPHHFKNCKKWWADYQIANDILNHPNDNNIRFLQWLPTLEMFYISLKHKRSIWQATTEDIEWNGESLDEY